jgi:anthranilate synthase component 2
MKILLIDNYDSFTYNLVHMLKSHEGVHVTVKRNDQVTVSEAAEFPKIILSPGPGIPEEAGMMPEIVRTLAPSKTIFGVCLGHQCIGEIFGASLKNIERPLHGKATPITRVVSDDPVLAGLPDTIEVGRYHSWVVDTKGFPNDTLEVTSIDGEGMIMSLRHRSYKVFGVQFHPESILTPCGETVIRNVLSL